ncbi:S1 family peptidase [Labilibacter marinus]|uniref:S1 family peptidase n=1 Tax=Labilibacter marinus TaxID=1477105 RepID=UPI0013012CF9|nr:serine protease [Labilibacter marinus]
MEKAVFTISSYDKNENLIASRTGFFISSDGIGIAPANVLLNPDSIAITLRNGRDYKVGKILSVHKLANLTMFKAIDHRQKGFEYIIPSQKTERDNNEVLIISNPEETEGGLSLGTVTKIHQAPYLDRMTQINANYGPQSAGAPVINSDGDLVGIANYINKGRMRHFLSTHILNDSLWINFSKESDWKKTLKTKHKHVLYPYMLEGISSFMNTDWVESAKKFSFQIKSDSSNLKAYILRGEARRQYENFMGMKLDFEYVNQNEPKHFLVSYFEALNHLEKNEDNKAFVSLIASIEQNEYYSPALIEFGLLAVKLRNDVETAKKCFDQAIKTTPLYAKGYYERSRLLIQYLDNNSTAMEDISKAIELNNFLPGAYSIRGTLRIQTEDYLEAISDFDKALDIDRNDTHALFNRGIAHYNLGMKNRCCEDWDAASQLGHYKSVKYMSRYCNKTPISRGR